MNFKEYLEEKYIMYCLSLLKNDIKLLIENNGIEIKDVKKIIPHNFYDVKIETWAMKGSPDVEMKSAYGKNGCYIGDLKTAQMLVDKFKIELFETPGKDYNVAAIGYSPKNKKWYGWSHRAICGFEIGNKIFEAKYGNDKTKFIEHGIETIKTLDDAKQSAINFARYVS